MIMQADSWRIDGSPSNLRDDGFTSLEMVLFLEHMAFVILAVELLMLMESFIYARNS